MIDREYIFSRSMPIPESGCWVWMKSENGHYGMISEWMGKRAKTYFAHRKSYEVHYGPVPKGMCVCHKCDNGLCVNPAHLFIGTYRDNTLDMMRKGRHSNGGKNPPRLVGEDHPRSKLTNAQREEIKKDTRPWQEVCKQYGISQTTFYDTRKAK